MCAPTTINHQNDVLAIVHVILFFLEQHKHLFPSQQVQTVAPVFGCAIVRWQEYMDATSRAQSLSIK